MNLELFIREYKLYELGITPNKNPLDIINIIESHLTCIQLIENNDGVTEILNNDKVIALYTDENGGMINISTEIHKRLFKSFDIDNSLIKHFGECLSIIGYFISSKLDLQIKNYTQCYSLYD